MESNSSYVKKELDKDEPQWRTPQFLTKNVHRQYFQSELRVSSGNNFGPIPSHREMGDKELYSIKHGDNNLLKNICIKNVFLKEKDGRKGGREEEERIIYKVPNFEQQNVLNYSPK